MGEGPLDLGPGTVVVFTGTSDPRNLTTLGARGVVWYWGGTEGGYWIDFEDGESSFFDPQTFDVVQAADPPAMDNVWVMPAAGGDPSAGRRPWNVRVGRGAVGSISVTERTLDDALAAARRIAAERGLPLVWTSPDGREVAGRERPAQNR